MSYATMSVDAVTAMAEDVIRRIDASRAAATEKWLRGYFALPNWWRRFRNRSEMTLDEMKDAVSRTELSFGDSMDYFGATNRSGTQYDVSKRILALCRHWIDGKVVISASDLEYIS